MPHVPEHPPAPPERFVCRTALFGTDWPQPDTTVVAGRGELDAANGHLFVDYALRHADRTRWLVVDFSGLSFFSTAGFSALHTLNVRCAGDDIRWALVPGRAVTRVLRLCDPDAALPVSPDVPSALVAVHDAPRQSFQLVTEPR
ncbi:STAS domain-containing protein [Mycolicibacterium parafortuitum]|uniref:STAS domain-containing protein n=1 Tax=Mycolicibacterium parafortuitum TaxID=39692 RepID=UPI000CF2E55F|nr:anti-sigma factor antagonist [Mycobacterium sp. EPG1]